MAQFKINVDSNSITPLRVHTFGELGFRERGKSSGMDSEGAVLPWRRFACHPKGICWFSETNERIDLLALDKQGSLVLIENKLDDTGRDLTWQALKYASYCSGLSKDNVRHVYQDFLDKTASGSDAKERITEFLDANDYEEITINRGITQRIILIAANFRKEVTSTVFWLSNFKLRIQCFRVTPYSMGDEHFLNIEQIIPTKDVEDFMIGIADKSLDEVEGATEEKNRHKFRREFWTEIVRALEGKTTRFSNITIGPYGSFGAGSGVSGTSYQFVASRTYGCVEIYIDRGDAEENTFIYDQLYSQKDQIQTIFGDKLTWEPLEGKRACRIKFEESGNIFDRDRWPAMIEFMTGAMLRLEKAFGEPLAVVNRKLRNRERAQPALPSASIAPQLAAEGSC